MCANAARARGTVAINLILKALRQRQVWRCTCASDHCTRSEEVAIMPGARMMYVWRRLHVHCVVCQVGILKVKLC